MFEYGLAWQSGLRGACVLVEGLTARQLVFRVLRKVLFEGAYADLALSAELSRSSLASVDRALATELCYGVLRNLTLLDWTLDSFLKQPICDALPATQVLLRLGAYQILMLDRIPPYAAVNSCVEIAKRFGAHPSLVNAVLRRIVSSGPRELPDWDDPEARISVEYSHPNWLVSYLLETFGLEEAVQICRANNKPAALTVRVNSIRSDVQHAAQLFSEDGVKTERCVYAAEGLKIVSQQIPLEKTRAHTQGMTYAMDEAAMLAAPLMGECDGKSVLDACAAPGGKTLHLAALMRNRGSILALDVSRARLGLLSQNAARLGAEIVRTELLDAREAKTRYSGAFDAALCDVPCSGLGVIRRRPDLRWRKHTLQISGLRKLQLQILDSVAQCVKPGGVLVYTTCSIHQDENEHNVHEFLSQNSEWRLDSVLGYVPENLKRFVTHGWLQLYTHLHGTDGFYFARLKRAGGQ